MTLARNADVPVQTAHIAIPGAVIEVTIAGALAPGVHVVVAAHPADALGAPAAALLAEITRATVVCVNPRGLGGSSPVEDSRTYTLEAMVDDIERVRAELEVSAWTFWGMSGGGWLGQVAARRHARSVAGLVCESVCGCFRARLADPACLLSPLHPSWRAPLATLGLVSGDAHLEAGDAHATGWIEVAGVGSVFRRMDGPALLVAPMPIGDEMRRVMPHLWSMDARPWLGAIRTPALVIAGEADPVVPVAHARAVHEAIAGSRFVVVPGGGHVPTLHKPPALMEAARAFMAQVGGGTPA